MKKKRKKFINNGCLKEQKDGFLRYISDLGYKEICFFRCYQYVLNSLEQYMFESQKTGYTREIGADFLKFEGRSGAHKPKMRETFKLVIRRFNEYMFNTEFIFKQPVSDRVCPEQFAETLNSCLSDMRTRGLKESTIELNRSIILKALKIFNNAGIRSLCDIKVSDIYTTFEQTTDKRNFSTPMRRFFQHAYETRLINADLSQFVPHKRKPQPVPSVFTKSEIEEFLNSFDQVSRMGKRDYAIALLALRLGIRSSDILNLKVGDIDFNTKTINFTQRKTQIPQRLELLPEIDTTIRAYLTSSRQEYPLENLFLTVRSPIRPISRQLIRDITSSHLYASGIKIGSRKRGPHSLRMTMASELVSENVPYDAVRKILGHEDPNAIKHYVKFDIEGLRPCAIGVPPVTGKFSDFMYAGRGGVQ
jgi:integrase